MRGQWRKNRSSEIRAHPTGQYVQHIQREHAVIAAFDRLSEQVVREYVKAPAIDHPSPDVLARNTSSKSVALTFLTSCCTKTRTESVATTDLEYMFAAGQHFRNELITRQAK
jgi:hypothetical protein